jgi:hypothetical protein
MSAHIKIRRVLERYRLGPKESGGVGVGELADLIEAALELRARDEAIIRATLDEYEMKRANQPTIDAIIAAAERDEAIAEAIQWRDWQTVEMLMDEADAEQQTP